MFTNHCPNPSPALISEYQTENVSASSSNLFNHTNPSSFVSDKESVDTHNSENDITTDAFIKSILSISSKNEGSLVRSKSSNGSIITSRDEGPLNSSTSMPSIREFYEKMNKDPKPFPSSQVQTVLTFLSKIKTEDSPLVSSEETDNSVK